MGKTSEYTWSLSTGWWTSRALIKPDAVVVVSLLSTGLIVGFIYVHRVRPSISIKAQYHQSINLIMVVATLYCLWFARQIYLVQPRRPAVGEEADLIHLFLPPTLYVHHVHEP